MNPDLPSPRRDPRVVALRKVLHTGVEAVGDCDEPQVHPCAFTGVELVGVIAVVAGALVMGITNLLAARSVHASRVTSARPYFVTSER